MRLCSGISNVTFVWLQAWVLYRQGNLLDIVDASIDYPEEEALRFIRVGLACTQVTPSSRPTMRQVVTMLSRPVVPHQLEMRPPSFAEHCGHSTDPTRPAAVPLVISSRKARRPPVSGITFGEVAPR